MFYKYSNLENRLIELFRSGAPDFKTAEKLIEKGADINAFTDESCDSNILAEILSGYWQSNMCDEFPKSCEYCDYQSCSKCNKVSKNPNPGKAMLQVIKFFLKHGFDVKKDNHRFGAQCLYELAISTFDEYILDAAKLLLDAGAKNISTSDFDSEKPSDHVEMERHYQESYCNNFHLGETLEALYQIFTAADENRSYNGISTYDKAYGKHIVKILAKKSKNADIFFDINLPESKHKNCFNTTLYFIYDSGVLILTQYVSVWTDTSLPDISFTDVSEAFPGISGNTITKIIFERNKIQKGIHEYIQPIINVIMDNGRKVQFSINHGENENTVGFYKII